MTKMNPWVPDNNPHQARRIGKTAEELGELQAVLARISIQGLHATDPSSGKTNFTRMMEETADVMAQLQLNVRHFFGTGCGAVYERMAKKITLMNEWEEHFPGEAPARSFVAGQHPDDMAVDRFAAEMKAKLAAARAKGRDGWEACDPATLSTMLREHVEKGDPRDVANFAMFLWSLGAPIAPVQEGGAI